MDEVDSILIDEARTPLIISGPSEESTDKYYRINRSFPSSRAVKSIEGKERGEKYTTGDYTIDEKHTSAALTEEGVLRPGKLLDIGNLYDPQNIEWNHHVQQALRAHVLYQRDREYVMMDRRGHYRRRVHGTLDARAPLERRIAPGGRSQRRRQDPAARTRRWPRSRSRTISACTKSWPA